MNVGVVLSTLGLVRGGLETIAANLATGLAGRGHQVTVIAGGPQGSDLAPDFDNLPVRWERAPSLPAMSPGWQRLLSRAGQGRPLEVQSHSFFYACQALPSIRQLMGELDVSLTFLEIETVKIAAWRQRLGKPNVSYFSGGISWQWLQRDRSALRLAISQTIADGYRRRPGFRIDGVVSPGVAEVWLYNEFVVRSAAQTLIFVGRLEANKGIRELLAIVAALAEKTPGLELRLVGDGPLRLEVAAEAQRLASRVRIVVLGALPPDAVRQELRRADLFVYPSHYESFGIAVLEAMASGLPVVCSDLPALCEVTGGAACRLPAGDVPAWTAAISSLLNDPTERRRLSQLGRATAGGLTWSRSVEALEVHLQQAVALRSIAERVETAPPRRP